jgi:hypothetical protein
VLRKILNGESLERFLLKVAIVLLGGIISFGGWVSYYSIRDLKVDIRDLGKEIQTIHLKNQEQDLCLQRLEGDLKYHIDGKVRR